MKTAQAGLSVTFTLGLVLGCGSNTERDWSKCTPSAPCKPGFVCSAEYRCLPADAQPDSVLAPPDSAVDSVIATPDAAVASLDTHGGADASVELDAPVTSPAVDAPVAADAPKDTFVEECRSSAECKEPSRSFCVSGVCAGCDQAGYGACPGKVCAPTGTPLVGGQCVACVTSTDCTNSTAPICVGNACVACSSPSQCAGKSSATPACLVATGACVACINDTTCPAGGFSHCDTKTNTCVGCATSVDCMGNTPICTAGVCGKCTISAQCAERDPTRPMCTSDGCVQCATNTDCAGAKDKPYCDPATKTCVACLTSQNCPEATPICEAGVCARCTEAAGACSTRSAATPACSGSGKCVQCTDTSNTCTGSTPACNGLAGLCVQCMNNTTCGSSTPVCDTGTKTCVGCLESATCPAATPVCDTKQKKCVECLDDIGCNKDPKKPFCTNGTCAACTIGDRCKAKNAKTPACSVTGSQAGACVECTDKTTCGAQLCDVSINKCVQCVGHGDCTGTTPFCTESKCRACASDNECSNNKSRQTPACVKSGPLSGACVACASDGYCTANDAFKCNPATNTCVQCLDNSSCSGNKPICGANNTCQACTADAQCAGIGPGVCMYHQDGRCASAEETYPVVNMAGVPTVAAMGARRLVVVHVAASGGIDWDLTNMSEFSIVGQNSGQRATILGNHTDPTVTVQNGSLYLRNVTIRDGNPGIQTLGGGGVLRLDGVEVSSNDSDGVRIVATAFDIRHSVISANTGCGVSLRYLTALASGPTSLAATTIIGNAGGGVCCVTSTDNPNPFQAVYVADNPSGNFGSSCSLTSCPSQSSSCGMMASIP